jgi:hypothetical protein
VFVLESSAYLNGWHEHYPPETFPSIWRPIEEALEDGRAAARGLHCEAV